MYARNDGRVLRKIKRETERERERGGAGEGGKRRKRAIVTHVGRAVPGRDWRERIPRADSPSGWKDVPVMMTIVRLGRG